MSDDLPSNRGVEWPDGIVDPATHFEGRPLVSREQILAAAKRQRQDEAERAAKAAESQLSAPIITNDPGFLIRAHAGQGNVVHDNGDGTFTAHATANTPQNATLKAAPMQGGKEVVFEDDGMVARVRRVPQPEEPDPFETLRRESFPQKPAQPKAAGEENQPQPQPQPQGTKGAQHKRTLKALDTTKPEDWSFYKYLGAKPGLHSLMLPSNGIYYNAAVGMRCFLWDDLWTIAQGIEAQNLTPIIDAIGASVDLAEGLTIRDLTLPDFYFLMYMQRIRSYPNTPLTYNFISQYGNAASFTVSEQTLIVAFLEGTRQDYVQAWESQGISPPRVKDWEAVQGIDFDAEEEMLWDRAQWLAGDSIEEKIAHAKMRGIPALELVRDFKASPYHGYGVEEVYTVRDPAFSPTQWLDGLVSDYEVQKALRKTLVDIQGKDSEDIEVLDLSMVSIQKTIDDLRGQLTRGEVVQADEEDVRVAVNALTFFPNV